MVKVNYHHNNSGGSWWLKDDDWYKLEMAGWIVHWKSLEKDSWADEDGRWLGALATSASKKFNSIEEGVEEFEQLTDQCATDEGCSCCGHPHSFYEREE